MEQIISKKSLEVILRAVSTTDIENDTEAKETLARLKKACGSCEKLSLVLIPEYEDYVIWEGAADVRNLIESGCYQEEIEKLPAQEQEDIIQKVTENVDWEDVTAVSIEAGNSLIERALDQFFMD